MTSKIRKQIYIDVEHETTLKQLAADTGVSEAEIIRQAVERYARTRRSPRRSLEAWERLRSRMQGLAEQGSVPGKRTWRREDLYDR